MSFGDWIGLLVFVIVILGPFILPIVKRMRDAQARRDEEESPETEPTGAPHPPPRRPTTEEEEIRKFLEALGRPSSAPPPPAPQRQPPPLPARPVRAPIQPVHVEGVSEEHDEQEAPVNVVTGEKIRQEFKPLERVDLTSEMKAVEAEVAQALKMASAPTPAATIAVARTHDFRKALTQKSSVRQAFVLAEVLGRPKGLD